MLVPQLLCREHDQISDDRSSQTVINEKKFRTLRREEMRKFLERAVLDIVHGVETKFQFLLSTIFYTYVFSRNKFYVSEPH